jgi:hypothetical protein
VNKARFWVCAGIALGVYGCVGSQLAWAQRIESYDAGVPAAASAAGPPRAPTAPPLLQTGSVPVAGSGSPTPSTDDAAASAPVSGGDPLVQNGLLSPLCGLAGAGLSAASSRNCETSNFEAAPAPTADYAFDIHIESGVLGVSAATLLQDYMIAPVWLSIVWIVHALIVAFEWCFTVDPLGGAVLGSATRGLHETQATFTEPWLKVALLIAALLALCRSILRRRAIDTLGQVVVMLAMVLAGMWVMLDPTGTVGLLGSWANQASLGTVGAVFQGTPANPSRALAEGMGLVFLSAVEEPWCFLEFGNVGWCQDPAHLDPRLRKVARGLASGTPSVQLVREARSNGELFLAFPANSPARNSVGAASSLLSTLCGGHDLSKCQRSTAELVEFRTESGTYARLEGLILITLGALGMILLLGFIAMHLLGSGVMSLFYLLLAPVAVLTPTCGERGRAIFRIWITRLLGSVTSKLLYSFLLGVVLLTTRLLTSLDTSGWWTRWLLLSVLWWGAFRHRHQVLGLAGSGALPVSGPRRRLGRALGGVLPRPYELVRAATRRRAHIPAPTRGTQGLKLNPRALGARGVSQQGLKPDEQALRVREHAQRGADTHEAAGPSIQVQLMRQQARLERIREQQQHALAAANTRRATQLGLRAERLQAAFADHHQQPLESADPASVTGGPRAAMPIHDRHWLARRSINEQQTFLDEQAILPAAGRPSSPSHGSIRRDYMSLAGLAGYSSEEYRGLDLSAQRRARAQIDRELAQRVRQRGLTRDAEIAAQRPPREPQEPSPDEPPNYSAMQTDPVMRDFFEFQEGRKSYLGWEPDEIPPGA